jgi:protein-disulfide isomerase
MDALQIEKIISGAALEGNAQADIVVIEYSDMECPFCIRQYSETKLRESLVTQYGDKVVFAFKNNRGVNHSGTEAKAVGTLCAKKVGGNGAYAKFYHTIMDGTTQSAVFPVANLAQAAKTAGVDVAKWQSCFDKKETAAEFAAETQEANSLGLGGTPGTLILNVKTGKYTTVEGAYPIANFVQKIDSLMK